MSNNLHLFDPDDIDRGSAPRSADAYTFRAAALFVGLEVIGVIAIAMFFSLMMPAEHWRSSIAPLYYAQSGAEEREQLWSLVAACVQGGGAPYACVVKRPTGMHYDRVPERCFASRETELHSVTLSGIADDEAIAIRCYTVGKVDWAWKWDTRQDAVIPPSDSLLMWEVLAWPDRGTNKSR